MSHQLNQGFSFSLSREQDLFDEESKIEFFSFLLDFMLSTSSSLRTASYLVVVLPETLHLL